MLAQRVPSHGASATLQVPQQRKCLADLAEGHGTDVSCALVDPSHGY